MTTTQKKLKILYLITKGNWGGAQRYVFDLATALPREEFEPVVAYGNKGMLTERLREAGIRTVYIQSLQRDISFGKECKALCELARLFRAERPDIIHLNSSKAALLGALASVFYRRTSLPAYNLKTIFTAHGWPFKEARPLLAKAMLYAATWLTVLFCHHTIVVSREDEKSGKCMWFVKSRIHYIPNAIQAPRFLPRETAEKILFLPDVDAHIINSIRLVTIAELTKNKGLQNGIDMMRELQERFPDKFTYTIFGEGEDLPNLQEQARNILNSQRNNPVVSFRYISMENMPSNLSTEASRYLKAFDIFILPSIKEGMPYVLLEAAAAGLPMVATDVVREEAKDLPNISFVPIKDGAALAVAVQNLKNEPPTHAAGVIRSFPTMLKRTTALYGTTL